jgi:hypothetical protein
MSATLFDTTATSNVTHACAGPACQVCALPDDQPGRARRTDPATSQAAGKDAAYRAGSQKALLLTAFTSHPDGLTDEEAAIIAGVSLTSEYAKRCSELRDAMLIVPRINPATGEPLTRVARSGLQRIVCRPVTS